GLFDRVKAVDDEMIAQGAPTDVFPTLYADIDQYEGIGEQSRTHHPLGKVGLAAKSEIHLAGLLNRQLGWPPTRSKQLHSGSTVHFAPNASLRSKAMGLGPPILALYRQLKLLEALDGIDSVVELSSQGVWCPDRRLLTGLFQAFGRPVPTPGSVIGISFSAS